MDIFNGILTFVFFVVHLQVKNVNCESELTDLDNEEPIDISDVIGQIYGKPDPNVGNILKTENLTLLNPEELGTYFEGDMLRPTPRGRNGMLDEVYRWKNGIVPFQIRGSFSKTELNLINSAINEYHKQTCIHFQPRTKEQDYIVFQNGMSGCWSSVGRVGNGPQVINLQNPGCVTKIGTVIHEMMHALGFLHEQNREDRDSYVAVNWSNIQKSAYNNFEKAAPKTTTAFGVSYDTGSVMHYSAYAFAINQGSPTITSKDASAMKTMGQRENFASSDVKKIWKMYKCKAPTSSGGTKPSNVHGIESIGDLISNVFKIGDEEEIVVN